jgi:hypothetical protein
MINDEYVKCNKNQIMKLVAIKINQDAKEKKNNIDTNVFDLAPSFYIKPQWYANLTLLCERDDKYHTINNSSHLYKSLGPIQFNTEIFAFTRTLFQSVLPFLVVLIFNSMIIYNLKKSNVLI